jgi:hypothetical protein
MMKSDIEDPGVRVPLLVAGKDRLMAVSDVHRDQMRGIARRVWHEPFAKRTWSELLFFALSVPLAAVGFAILATTMFAGVALAVTFISWCRG